MPNQDLTERRLSLEGALNFRDLGGYTTHEGRRVRWGTVFRSDRLSALTDADHRVLTGIGLSLVCDLRSHDECAEKPNRLHAEAPPAVEHVPVEVEAGHTMEALITAGERDPRRLREVVVGGYREFVHVHQQAWGQLLRHLLEARTGAAVFHCSAGQDRTGFASALLLLALGVPRATVVEDYMLTAVYRPGWLAVQDLEGGPLPVDQLVEIWAPGPDLLEASLAEIDAGFGSVDGYLEALGLDARARSALRERFVDEG